MVKMNGCAAIDFRPSVSLFGRQGGGCRRFPFGKWRLLTWETENSKHSKCMYTCEKRCGRPSFTCRIASKSGEIHTGMAVPTRAFACWETPQTLQQFHRNWLRTVGAISNYLPNLSFVVTSVGAIIGTPEEFSIWTGSFYQAATTKRTFKLFFLQIFSISLF